MNHSTVIVMFVSNLAPHSKGASFPSSIRVNRTSFFLPFARALRGCHCPSRVGKGKKTALPGNFGTRPLHPNIIWHSIKGKGERIRREEERGGKERGKDQATTLCLSVCVCLSLVSRLPSAVPVIILGGRWSALRRGNEGFCHCIGGALGALLQDGTVVRRAFIHMHAPLATPTRIRIMVLFGITGFSEKGRAQWITLTKNRPMERRYGTSIYALVGLSFNIS